MLASSSVLKVSFAAHFNKVLPGSAFSMDIVDAATVGRKHCGICVAGLIAYISATYQLSDISASHWKLSQCYLLDDDTYHSICFGNVHEWTWLHPTRSFGQLVIAKSRSTPFKLRIVLLILYSGY